MKRTGSTIWISTFRAFKKEDIKVELHDGYLQVSAVKGLNEEEKDEKGKLIRQERYSGSMQRSFYVGDSIKQEDVKAKFEQGVLKLSFPKEGEKKLPENQTNHQINSHQTGSVLTYSFPPYISSDRTAGMSFRGKRGSLLIAYSLFLFTVPIISILLALSICEC